MSFRAPVLAVLIAAPAVAAEPPAFKAGIAKTDITPDHPIRLNGFGFRRTESEGVYQKVWAKALAIDTGDGKPAVLMTTDVLGIPADVYDELVRRLAKAGVTRERLAITATHTHTGPMLVGANVTIFGTPIPKEHQANIDKYTPIFLDKLEAVALAALKDLKPAKLSWGVGTVGFGMNRRKREIAPTDHDLPALFVTDEKGKVRAVYVSYACHAVTLSLNKLGGDWPGFAAAAIEDTFADSVALISIGCGADQNPNSGVTGDNIDVAAAQGRMVAAEVKRLSENFLAPVTGPLTAKLYSVDLPLTDHPTREQWQEKAKRTDAIGHHARVTLAKLDRGEKLPTAVPYPVLTWAFGDSLAMVHLPGEVVVDYSLRLKAELDGRRLWVTAYANNAPCYIPSERVLKEGGYEGGGAMIYYDLPTPFKPGLEEKVIAAVKAQVAGGFGAKFDPAKTGGTRPLSPQQSLAAIHTHPELRVELVAAEPLVADPVAIAFGPDGKLWVAEMADYPNGRTGTFDPGGRVVVLEDRGGTGRPDTSTVFLDNLPFPTGVLPWRKGVLICAAPDILYAEDTDGDGKADKVTKLYSGFGTHNYQGRVNSLQYGLDGWVYGSCGLFGGNIKCHLTGKTVALGDRDFRIKPDTGELEPASGRTQQGRVRDDWGNWFGCDNSDLIRHYPLDDHYLRRNPHVAAGNTTVHVAPSKNLFSLKTDAQRFQLSGPPNTVTAACGLGIYRDDLLGEGYTGNSFTCEPVNLLVHRLQLKPKGTTFAGMRAADEQESEFLASTDNWFRPVHATTGPDGALWVADMYRYLIEHPRWVPPADLAKIDVRAGAGLGRLYRVRPAGKELRPWLRLDKLDAAGLVAALDSPNGVQRDLAMMMLIWQPDDVRRASLAKLVRESPRPETRLQALGTLDALGKLTEEIVFAALDDRDPGVRRHAVRVAEPFFVGERRILGVIAAHAGRDTPPVKLQSVLTIGAGDSPVVSGTLAELALESANDPLVLAAVSSGLNAGNLPLFARSLIARSGKSGPPPAFVRAVFATAAGADGGSALPGMLTLFAKPIDGKFEPWQLAAASGAMGRGWDKLPADTRAALEPLIGYAREVVAKEDATEAATLAAIPLLGRDAADAKRLAALLTPMRPASVQAAAVTALGRMSDDAVPPALIAAWPGASPRLRESILDALIARPEGRSALILAVEANTIPYGMIDAGRRQVLRGHPDPGVKRERLLGELVDPNRQKVIAGYEAGLTVSGDRARGKVVFAKTCAACHQLDGVGSAVGPDLAAVANKTPRYLLAEILDPNRNLDSRYVEYQANTKDGRLVVGVLAAETATGITLRGQQGKEETILRSDLDSLRGTGKSLMPEGLEKDVPKDAMADLIAYLTAADPPAKKVHGNQPAEVVAADGTLTLPATKAFLHGDQITFELEFWNIGYWSGEHDFAVWKVRLPAAAAFDVYLDYACAPDSAGNKLVLEGADPVLRTVVASTGGWERYTLTKLGTVKLPAGEGRVSVRPDGPVKGALLDLRNVYLVPVGAKPQVPETYQPKPVPPNEVAKLILVESAPRARREALVRDAVPHAAEVIRAMTADLRDDAKEEYRRIPWVWRIAVAAGRKNDTEALRKLLDAVLPPEGGRLRDWQAVVLGGGIVNGLSLEGVRPQQRIAEVIGEDKSLIVRWQSALGAALTMADDAKVPTGTRYDALRMVGVAAWDAAGPVLTKQLAKAAHPELQMGAVSGLLDAERLEADEALLKALPDVTAENRKLAVAGLLRTADRVKMLLDAIATGGAKAEWVTKEQREALAKFPDTSVRKRAAEVLGP